MNIILIWTLSWKNENIKMFLIHTSKAKVFCNRRSEKKSCDYKTRRKFSTYATQQGRRKFWKSGGGGTNSNVVGIICPLNIGITYLIKSGGMGGGGVLHSYIPVRLCTVTECRIAAHWNRSKYLLKDRIIDL